MHISRSTLQILLSLLAALATIIAALISKGETPWIYYILSFATGTLIGASICIQKISFRLLIPVLIILVISIISIIIIYFTPANQLPVLINLTSDKNSPQIPGTSIRWTVEAIDKDNDPIYYKFLLKGPSTSDNWQDMTNWTSSRSWDWKTTSLDIGANSIRATISDRKDVKMGSDSMDVGYTLASAKIISPVENDVVSGFQPIKGTSKGIQPGTWKTKSPNWRSTSDGYQLWIFVYPLGDGYHPQDLDVNVDANGDWFTQAGIGGGEVDKGHKFNLLAVLADENATNTINLYYEEHNGSSNWPGLPGLPKGAVQVDEVSVVRG